MIVLLGVFYSFSPEIILFSSLQLLIMLLIIFIPVILFYDIKPNFYPVYAVIIAGVIFQSGWVFLQRVNNGPLGKDIEVFISGTELGITSSENREIYRSTGTFFEPSIMGTYMLIHLGLLLYLRFFKKISRFIIKPINWALIAGSVAIVFTGSRAIYLFYLLLLIFIFYSKKQLVIKTIKSSSKLKLWVFFIIISAIFYQYLIPRLSSITDIFTTYGTVSYRLQMIQYAVKLGINNLLGVGINMTPYNYATTFPKEKFVFDPTYTHNLFFQLFAETGIIGLSVFLIFLYLIFRKSLIDKRHRINEFGIAAIMFLLCAQFYPIFLNHPEISSYLFLYIGLFYYKQIT